jgi:hypothetical protein
LSWAGCAVEFQLKNILLKFQADSNDEIAEKLVVSGVSFLLNPALDADAKRAEKRRFLLFISVDPRFSASQLNSGLIMFPLKRRTCIRHLSYARSLRKRSFVLWMSRHSADFISTILLYLKRTFNSIKGE